MALKDNARCLPIARTGRVQDWIDDPSGRLPVSCTVFVVEDCMEDEDGIEASWRFVSHGLRNGAGVAVHLSKLRPEGSDNGKGLIASGPVSFGMIYSKLNEVLRRGGKFKNGAVVLHLDYSHPDAIKFVSAPRHLFPWAKRCLNVDNHFLDKASPKLIAATIKGITNGDVWLTKIKTDDSGSRIYGNVCLEVLLPHRGTCLLQHVNLGALSIMQPEQFINAFKQGMGQLCELHGKTGVGDTGEYLPPSIDRQVGLGLLGLANCLAIHGISYADFADALEGSTNNADASRLVDLMRSGINEAAQIARDNEMERAFCIAPTASCAYRHLDSEGFTTAPEIAPPIGRIVDRDSGTFNVEPFNHGEVEIASEVGWDVYKRVANDIVSMMQATGLLHGYSYNWWSDMVQCDEAFLRDWLVSPQTSLYYALPVMPNVQAKDDAYVALDDEFKELLGLQDELPQGQQCTSCSE